MVLFISPQVLYTPHCSSRRWFSAPCGHHTGRHRGYCPPCSARGHCQGGRGRRGAGHRCASPRPGRPPPPRGVQGHRLGADGYSCPSARAIFVFIVFFLGCGLAARPHRLFDLRRHGRRRTSPSDGCSAQRPSAGEHRHRLLVHQLCQLV
jgi:membrane-associated phospholipid phosphatase